MNQDTSAASAQSLKETCAIVSNGHDGVVALDGGTESALLAWPTNLCGDTIMDDDKAKLDKAKSATKDATADKEQVHLHEDGEVKGASDKLSGGKKAADEFVDAAKKR